VTTRLSEIVIDCREPVALARWWEETLAWRSSASADTGSPMLRAPGNDDVPVLLFLTVPGPKRGKNRVHLDLATESLDEQAALVDGLIARDATRADVGQGDVPWIVLADPEGNEFCVLEPRDGYRGRGRLAGITLDSAHPLAVAPFWVAATGWSIASQQQGAVTLLPPSGRPPDLVLVQTDDPKKTKLRWHLDVEPVGGTSVEAEAKRLRELGAVDIDIGQHDDPATDWIVLADPEGNEFCIVPPL
jgi:predicted enzyme related to lactoylglutathione lyase